MDGAHTSESNELFDARLKGMDPEWGVRDVAKLSALASQHGLALVEKAAMPANNFVMCYKRLASQ